MCVYMSNGQLHINTDWSAGGHIQINYKCGSNVSLNIQTPLDHLQQTQGQTFKHWLTDINQPANKTGACHLGLQYQIVHKQTVS